jgi:hypothetical protein
MPELFKQPSSRIVQIDGEHALCDDGSIWVQYENRQPPYMWVLVSAPHKPPTQSDDLEEVLDALESIMTNPDNDFQPTFGWEILRKHGRCK